MGKHHEDEAYRQMRLFPVSFFTYTLVLSKLFLLSPIVGMDTVQKSVHKRHEDEAYQAMRLVLLWL